MTRRIDLQTLIDSTPVGKMQWFIIVSCFLVVMLDGFDTAAIGFIAPDISIHWQLDASDLALLFGAGLFGLTAGALVCGPLSDRIGRKRVIQLCVALFGVLSLLSAFSPNLNTLIILRFLTGLGLGGALPNAVTMTSEYLPARRKSALVTLMFCGFTLGSAMGGIISAQLMSVIGWRGILVLGGALPLMLFVVLLFALPESPRWQVYRQLPQRIITRTVSAITKENYDNPIFYLKETAATSKGSVHDLFVRHQLPITLMLWGVFFMSMLIIYFLSSWMPTLFIHRGMDVHNASLVTAAFQIGGTLGALVLGMLMDQYNPFRVLAVSYVLGALCITMIGVSDDGLWLLVLATFGSGVGISGSQVGLNALTATLYPTQSRATGVSWSNAVGRGGAIFGSFSGGVMIAMNISFDTLFFIIAIPATISAVLLILLTIVVRQSASILDPLPRVGVVNNK